MKKFVLSLIALIALVAFGLAADAQGPIRNALNNWRYGSSAPQTCTGPECGNYVPASLPIPMTAANVAAAKEADAKAGRSALFYDLVRATVAKQAVKNGASRVDAHAAAQALTNAVIDGAMAQVKVPAGVLGDGHILQILIDFLSSPVGQMLLNLLLSLLGL